MKYVIDAILDVYSVIDVDEEKTEAPPKAQATPAPPK